MKPILLLLILCSCAYGQAYDTTKAECGKCFSPSEVFSEPLSDIFYIDNCEKLPINCRWECIDGELYRICRRDEAHKLTNNNYPDTIRVCDTMIGIRVSGCTLGWLEFEEYIEDITCRDSVVWRER